MAGSKLSSLLPTISEVVSTKFLDNGDFLMKNAGPLDTIVLCCDNEVSFSGVEEEDGKDSMESEKSRNKVSLRQDFRSAVSAGRGGGHEADLSNGYK